MGERKKRIGGTGMKWYAIGKTLTPLDRAPESGAAVVLLNSDELAHETALPGLEAVLHRTPSARDAHVCKAEVRSNCLSGTLALPRGRRDGTRLCCGYLVTKNRVVLVDDGEMAEPYLKHIVKEKRLIENSVGRFLYDFFELLIARDLHRLEEIEDRATALEERVLAGELEEFSTPMSELRKETMAWYRYYSQLDDVACELRENENGYFSDEECGLFRLFEERVIRLREESQLLREYCTQIQSLFQSEIDIRQNRIMQILSRLEKVEKQREQGRRSRAKADIPTVSLVGYTNAGKQRSLTRSPLPRSMPRTSCSPPWTRRCAALTSLTSAKRYWPIPSALFAICRTIW